MVNKIIALALVVIISGCAVVPLRPKSENFKIEVKKMMTAEKRLPAVNELQGKAVRIGKGSTTIQIKNVALEDFIRVVFSEALKFPYVLDLSVAQLEKRVDVEILSSYSIKDLYSVVMSILEKSGCEVEDVEGVLLITVRHPAARSGGPSVGGESDQNGKREKVNDQADMIYTYQPLFARAADIHKSISALLTSDQSKSILHESNNSLIIKSSVKEKRSIVRLLRLLDQRPKQVGVDVTIAEITLTGDLSMGLEGFLNTEFIDIKAGAVPSNGYGLTGSLFISDWLKAIVQMGEKQGLISIKSNPYLLISDGMKSSIAIGSEYPILTSQKTASGDDSIISQVDYRKTGIILSLSPVVSGNDVHLTSIIEMSEGQKNDISTIDSPSILTRRIESSVILESGQTLIVGGLISETDNRTNIYFPGLKGLGLQTGKSEKNDRTEIVVLLNVSVINEKNADDWFRVLGEKYNNQKISQ